MVVIRLARTGRAKYPTYRIVAADSKRAATGKFVEILGHYNPHTKELVIKKDETVKRLQTGAQPSNTVVKLLMREKIELPAWVKLKTKQPKAKEEPEVKAEVAEEAPQEEAPAADEGPAVAEAATEAATEKEAPEATDEHTETAEDTDAAADAAKDANEAGAEASDDAK